MKAQIASQMTDPALWARVLAQPLTVGSRSLTDQFARDTGHSAATARRLVTEYRRFLYLVAVNKGILAPSRLVDRAWHLHLADPPAYQDFCEALFGRQILHLEGRPAPFNDPAYHATLTSYQQEFGLKPGSRMWPTPEDEVPRARRIGAAIVLGIVGLYAWGSGYGWLAAGAFGGAVISFALSVLVTPWPVNIPPGSTSGCGGGSIGDSGSHCSSDGDGSDGGGDGGGCGGCGGD
jgi:uncharacterized membrane protein YgcG